MPGAAPTAPLLRRMAAFVYEGVLMFGVLMIAGLVYATVTQQRHGLQGRLGLQVFIFLVLGAYFAGFWMHGGQTLAMKTWRIRLETADGAPLTPGRAVARYLAGWIWFLPALMLGWLAHGQTQSALFGVLGLWILAYALSARLTPDGNFWHDRWCGTRLVDIRGPA